MFQLGLSQGEVINILHQSVGGYEAGTHDDDVQISPEFLGDVTFGVIRVKNHENGFCAPDPFPDCRDHLWRDGTALDEMNSPAEFMRLDRGPITGTNLDIDPEHLAVPHRLHKKRIEY